MKNKPFRVISALLLACSAQLASAAGVVNVYNWSDYIAKDTIPGFEKQTGIKVRYDNYDSNETLQSKLLTGSSGYDIVTPTSDFMAKQIQAGAFQKLDKSKLPNLRNLDPALMAKIAGADPGNQYGVPWAYGTDGLGYNLNKVKPLLGKDAPLDDWDNLFNPQKAAKLQACGISVLDDAKAVFASTLHYLGKNPNSHNASDYQAAFQTLKQIRPYIKRFSSSGYINELANGDICMVLGYSGDVVIAKTRAAEAKRPYQLAYFIPKTGAPLWFDVMVIPKGAKNVDSALQWINYMQTPQVNAGITNTVFYPTANAEARKYVKADIANDPAIYPPPAMIGKLFLLEPLPAEILRLQNRLWTQLKTGR